MPKIIYLGNVADIDPVEGNALYESAAALVGLSSDFNTLQILFATESDGGDGVSADQDFGSTDNVSYNLGAGPVTTRTDSSLEALVTVTAPDGSSQDISVVVIQGENGDLFISDLLNGGTLDNLVISAVEILSVSDTSSTGWASDQFVNDSVIAPFTTTPTLGPVDGTFLGEVMDPGYVDGQGDIIDGADGIDDTIFGNGGDDTINAGLGDDTVDGGTGDDVIDGGVGNNSIDGGKGDDTFIGGDGADTFGGSFGQDVVDYSNSDAAVSVDLLTGFLSGGDADNDSLAGGVDGIIGSEFDDTLTGYDGEGTDPSDLYTNEIFGEGGNDTISGLSGGDLLDGGADDDLIDGGDDDDTIVGGTGNDTITGGEGADSMAGGDDRDTFLIGSVADADGDTIDGGAGGDDFDVLDLTGMGPTQVISTPDPDGNSTSGTVNFLDSAGSITGTLEFSEIESLIVDPPVGGGPVDGLGIAETMVPGYTDAEGDMIDGSDGIDDTIFGNGGDDTINAGLGDDTVDGGADDDSILGGAGDDEITGGTGNDTILGGAGTDISSGGDDRDTFRFDSVADADGDTVDGGAGGDDFDVLDLTGLGPTSVTSTPDPDGNSSSGTVNFLDSTGGVIGTLEFSEIAELIVDPPATPGAVDGLATGEDMDPGCVDAQGDIIDGADGLDDTIFGNGGDETIDSGAGDDTVDGGAGDDVFDINDEGAGIDNDEITGGEAGETGGDVLDAGDITDDLTLDILAPEEGILTDGTDTTSFEEIENFVLGSGDDTVIGSDGGDNVDGGEGDDSIDARGGDDTIESGTGNDTIFTGDGSDVVTSTSGDNVIDTSGPGITTLPDIGFPAYGPFPPIPADTDTENDRDSVTTGAGADEITTGDDADTISSGAGNDTIDSGIDDDIVDAGEGDDSITTGEGNDDVLGGGGDDTIYGGLGPSAPDGLSIPDDIPGPFGPDPVTNNGMDTIDGGAGNDVIFGEDDDDSLIGGSGDDSLDGGIDDDTLEGGIGADELTGGQGADSLSGGDDSDTFIIGSAPDAFGDAVDGGTGGVDVDTLDLTGLGEFEVIDQTVDADGDSTSGTVNFLDGAGLITGSMTFSEIENLVICFTPGTRIATPKGEVLVEDLHAGDRIITRDDGVQEINWIGRKQLSARDLIDDPKLRPVLIKKGSLGNDLPEQDMMVSPNHRMLLANAETHMLFDEREVLVSAKHLSGQDGISQIDTLGTEYIHVMFKRHEVILANGAWTESFQPGDHSLNGIDGDQRSEIFKLFPELEKAEGRRSYASARQSLKAHEAQTLRQVMHLK